MTEPTYRTDINGLADGLRLAYGSNALDVAAQNARQHFSEAAWKDCALWLRVVNLLSAPLDHSDDGYPAAGI